MPSDTFSAGDLTAIIGDNAADGPHRAGYNGLWSLTHKAEKTNLFVPAVAGLNLEHIFDGETLDAKGETKIFFEPRNSPMEFKKVSATEAELHQPPTPTFFLESWTTFKLVEPHYVDFAFRCRATQHVFRRGYIGLFWANYINAPDDKSMYLRGKDLWLQHCTPAHDTLSTVVRSDRGDPVYPLPEWRRDEHRAADDQPGLGLPVRDPEIRREHRLRIQRPARVPAPLLARGRAQGIRNLAEGVRPISNMPAVPAWWRPESP
jgi:hypothetical protein